MFPTRLISSLEDFDNASDTAVAAMSLPMAKPPAFTVSLMIPDAISSAEISPPANADTFSTMEAGSVIPTATKPDLTPSSWDRPNLSPTAVMAFPTVDSSCLFRIFLKLFGSSVYSIPSTMIFGSKEDGLLFVPI